jgi:DNA gyrase subunit B
LICFGEDFRAEIDKNARKLKLGKDKVEKDDILAGLTAIIAVRVPEPQFEGQTKEVLGTPGIKAIVSQVVSQGLSESLLEASVKTKPLPWLCKRRSWPR